MKSRILLPRSGAFVTAVLLPSILLTSLGACRHAEAPPAFATPEDAVKALTGAVRANDLQRVLAIFGPDGQALIDSSDAATARRNRDIFAVAIAERWHLEDHGPATKILVIGNEDWPFPVPLVKDGNAWRFDTAAGKEEVLARRIGRNELTAMRICRAYVVAQHIYASRPHDGKPRGTFARAFASDTGRENGLYWPTARGRKRSPLGDLLAEAADEAAARRASAGQPQPFHGYYFRILTAQGAAAPGGARDYVVNGELSGGFALVAWPAQYDVTGIMTFIVNRDGVVWEKDAGSETAAAAQAMTRYDPDSSWSAVQ
jgi:hypothetical protein